MYHVMRCRGGEWVVGECFWIGEARLYNRATGKYEGKGINSVNWNATLRGSRCEAVWPSSLAWLLIAWICCEIDPVEGARFAEAILDAEPYDDAPALAAFEWMERRTAMGVLPVYGEYRKRMTEREGPPFSLAAWGRELIAMRRLLCGERRDGEDVLIFSQGIRFREARRNDPVWREPMYQRLFCPHCDLPRHRFSHLPDLPAVLK